MLFKLRTWLDPGPPLRLEIEAEVELSLRLAAAPGPPGAPRPKALLEARAEKGLRFRTDPAVGSGVDVKTVRVRLPLDGIDNGLVKAAARGRIGILANPDPARTFVVAERKGLCVAEGIIAAQWCGAAVSRSKFATPCESRLAAVSVERTEPYVSIIIIQIFLRET